MKTKALLFSFILAVCLAAPTISLAQGAKKPGTRGQRGIRVEENTTRAKRPVSSKGRSIALLIGNDAYQKSTGGAWPDLKTAVNDVVVLAQVLKKRYGLRPENLILVRNGTRQQIISAFNRLSEMADPEDSVLIYYGGHGQYINNRGFWVPVDGRTRANYISNADILASLGEIKAKHKLLISDSCFSGQLFAKTRGPAPAQSSALLTKSEIAELSELKSAQGFSSGGVQPVSDGGAQWDGHSIFAYHLISRLRANRKPYLSASALGAVVGLQVANDTRDFMGQDGAQTPISRPLANQRHQGGEYFFTPVDVEIKTIPVTLFLARAPNPDFDPYAKKAVQAIQAAMIQRIRDNYLEVKGVKIVRGEMDMDLLPHLANGKAATGLVLSLEGGRKKQAGMMWQGVYSLRMQLRAFRYQKNRFRKAGAVKIKRQLLPVIQWSDDPKAIEDNYERIAKKMVRKWPVNEMNKFLRALN